METCKHTKLLMDRVDDQWQPKKDDQGAHYMRNLRKIRGWYNANLETFK